MDGSLHLWEQDRTARELRVKEGTLQNWRSRGEGPPFVKIGSRVFYEAEAVREWVRSRRRTSTGCFDIARQEESPVR